MIDKIIVGLGERSYPIYISNNFLSAVGETCKTLGLKGNVLIITNDKIYGHYGEQTLKSFTDANYKTEIFQIPDGEKYKCLETISQIYDHLIGGNYSRQTILAALGGGVVGDITGFAAATYMRGIKFIQIPTSLVAMVDSSVGGKTGVNHPKGKNIIGSFYQPSLVYVDTNLLKTLPCEEFIAGLAEVIKYGIIRDNNFFEFLASHSSQILKLSDDEIKKIVYTSCKIKSEIVEKDEREAGLRAILNFGHTVGHAIETLTNYNKFKHGEAVALGMMAASFIAQEIEIFSNIYLQKLWDLIKKFKLPYKLSKDFPYDKVAEQLLKDKKVMDGKVRFVLPRKIGEVIIRDDIKSDAIINALKRMK